MKQTEVEELQRQVERLQRDLTFQLKANDHLLNKARAFEIQRNDLAKRVREQATADLLFEALKAIATEVRPPAETPSYASLQNALAQQRNALANTQPSDSLGFGGGYNALAGFGPRYGYFGGL